MATVLVAEDNEMNMELLCTILTANGFDTVCAENGRQALQRIEDSIPDLVLMDIQMPVLDGYQTLNVMRKNAAMDKIPIVAVTGNAMTHDREKILAEGFHDVVTKPFSINSVLTTVRKHLEARDLPS